MHAQSDAWLKKTYVSGFFRLLRMLVVLVIVSGFVGYAQSQPAVRAEGPNAILDLPGCTTSTLAKNDDSSSPKVSLPFSLNFVGTSYASIYVNNNGNVTFDATLSAYRPFGLITTTRVIIAPFFMDIDTRGAGSQAVTYGAASYAGRPAFCANWVNVGYYSYHYDVLNSFQLLLVERFDTGPGNFDIIMNYDKINMDTSDTSGAVRVGYSNGSSFSYEMPGSGTLESFRNANPTGLIYSSRDSLQKGRYIFPVRNGVAPSGGSIAGTVYANSAAPANILAGALVQVCAGNTCHPTNTNAGGKYQVTGLPAASYTVEAFPPSASTLSPRTIGPFALTADQMLEGKDVVLGTPVPMPAGTTLNPSNLSGGYLHVDLNDALTLKTTGCAGASAGYQILKGSAVLRSGSLVEDPAGSYTATLPALVPNRGDARVVITLNCPAGSPSTIPFDIYIDPSGLVRTLSGTPVSGATVTLYRSDSASGPFAVVPNNSGILSPSNRSNPDTTDAAGRFGWDVVAGYYKVRAEKAGCSSPGNTMQAYSESNVLQIPPPEDNLQLLLYCGGSLYHRWVPVSLR